MKNTITLNANNALALDCLDAVYDGTNTLYLAFITSESFDVMAGTQKLGTITPANNTLLIDSSKYLEADLVLTINGSTITIKAPETAVGNMTVTAEDEATYQVKFYQKSSGGSNVTITPTLTSGTKIADYSIDGVPGELYSASGGATIYVDDEPPSNANEGDLYVELVDKSAYQEATVTSGGGINIESIISTDNRYTLLADIVSDYQNEVLYFEFDGLEAGREYTFDCDMQIISDHELANWGQYGFSIISTTTYIESAAVAGLGYQGAEYGGQLHTLDNGWMIGIYYDTLSHHYSHTFTALGTTMYLTIDVGYLVNTQYGYNVSLHITDLRLKPADDNTKAGNLRKVYTTAGWVDFEYLKSVEPLLTTGAQIATLLTANQESVSLFAPSGGGGGSGVTHTSYEGTSMSLSTDVNSITIPEGLTDAMYIIIGRTTNFVTIFVGKLSYDYGMILYGGNGSGMQLVSTSYAYAGGVLTITGADYVLSSNESGKTYDVYLF